jgi:lipopolysaccharide export system protein LptA
MIRRLLLLSLVSTIPIRAAETARVAAAPAPAAPVVPTVIESGTFEMVSSPKETTSVFRQEVTVTGTNLKITCDELVVVTRRAGDPAATLGKQENFKSLVATGHVHIVQGDREAFAARGEIFPGEDKIVLSGDPVVRSTKEGWEQTGPGMQLVLYRGQRRAVLEGPPGTRTKITLPPMKDLGDLGEKAKAKKPEARPADKAPEPETLPPLTVPVPPQPK